MRACVVCGAGKQPWKHCRQSWRPSPARTTSRLLLARCSRLPCSTLRQQRPQHQARSAAHLPFTSIAARLSEAPCKCAAHCESWLIHDCAFKITLARCLQSVWDVREWAGLQGSNEGEQDEDKERPLPLLHTLKALQAAWQAASSDTAIAHAHDMSQALQESLQPGLTPLLAPHMHVSHASIRFTLLSLSLDMCQCSTPIWLHHQLALLTATPNKHAVWRVPIWLVWLQAFHGRFMQQR